jgi:hypothetical protein
LRRPSTWWPDLHRHRRRRGKGGGSGTAQRDPWRAAFSPARPLTRLVTRLWFTRPLLNVWPPLGEARRQPRSLRQRSLLLCSANPDPGQGSACKMAS